MKGVFITFEGIEGCGKSTQAGYLFENLRKKGSDVILTREPGGTELGAKIRNLILNSTFVFPLAELFLFLADRNQHVNEIIKPALESGSIVICDRFYHSTYAYQAAGRQFDIQNIKFMNELSIEGIKPDITYLIDVPIDVGFGRKMKKGFGLDRIEKEDHEFHKIIREAYLNMKNEKNIYLLDGTKPAEDIKTIIYNTTIALLNEKNKP